MKVSQIGLDLAKDVFQVRVRLSFNPQTHIKILKLKYF
jgi:hypothetical protein